MILLIHLLKSTVVGRFLTQIEMNQMKIQVTMIFDEAEEVKAKKYDKILARLVC